MRHLKAGRKFGRTSAHRKALFRNLVTALLEREKIRTTLPKAKELRSKVEKTITLGKKGTLHARRQAFKNVNDKAVVQKLFGPLAERYAKRNGGYTRIIKLGNRLGDDAPMAYHRAGGGRRAEGEGNEGESQGQTEEGGRTGGRRKENREEEGARGQSARRQGEKGGAEKSGNERSEESPPPNRKKRLPRKRKTKTKNNSQRFNPASTFRTASPLKRHSTPLALLSVSRLPPQCGQTQTSNKNTPLPRIFARSKEGLIIWAVEWERNVFSSARCSPGRQWVPG